MPNHVINEVVIRVLNDELAQRIRDKVVNAEGYVDFELLLPPPINYWQGSAGAREESAFPGTWLDWCTANWSTKWNAYGQQDDEGYTPVVYHDGVLKLTFKTAWSPPRGWLCALFNTFKTSIDYSFFDEGASYPYRGSFDWAALVGDDFTKRAWSEHQISDDEAEHKRLYKLLWGFDKGDDE